MLTLTVTAKGQVTLKQDLLKHLGVAPGSKIEVDPLPDGRIIIKAVRSGEKISNAFGVLAKKNKQNITLSIDEISDLAKAGWAGNK